jgi:transcriptional regulator with XRE-family HTH domain
MLQPEEIKAFRKNLGLTQEELAHLMGWSEATVNRYEKGALQEQSHDNALRMAMTSGGLKVLLETKRDALPAKKRERLLSGCSTAPSLEDVVLDIVLQEESIYNGYCIFSLAKFKAVVGFLASSPSGVWQTTLNKLLWYADFLYFREQGIGITGLVYTRLPYGPVPEKYKLLMELLPENEFEFLSEEFPNGCAGERIHFFGTYDPSLFTASEKRVLEAVRDRLAQKSASEISNLSHEEPAWKDTQPLGRISYELAKEIKLTI